jgi:hypothetical protein
MEDVLVDKDQWVVVDLGTQSTSTKTTSTQSIGTRKSWIERQRAQSDCVSQIQYY